ncbi:MAG: serine/threonine protein kinase [Bryobacterales bacterium]|nr:serine/threonine protein kinase [Bryobacterales bacterium]
MRYQAGQQIGEYRILSHLGSGASGDVFRVEHRITRRTEAIKVFYGTIVDEERAQRIVREAMLQAKLNHPGITAVHTAFWHQDDLLLVMEFIEGESLRQTMDRGRVEYFTALSYAGQVLRALIHAHQNGVVHRDISPANILVTPKGRIKLTDFGLAKKPGDRRITQSGIMMGSIHYTAPEQIKSSADVDFRADIYSTAAVLYELFTTERPFEGDSPFDLMLAHAETRPIPPSHRRADLPPHLDAALLRALEKDPARRFSSAAEFLVALVPDSPRPERGWRVSANVWTAAAFSLVAALFVALALGSPGLRHGKERPALAIPLRPPPPPVPPPEAFEKSKAEEKHDLAPRSAPKEPEPTPPPMPRSTARAAKPVAAKMAPRPRPPATSDLPPAPRTSTSPPPPPAAVLPPPVVPRRPPGFWSNFGRKVNIFRRHQ